jgi:hypothetical protein
MSLQALLQERALLQQRAANLLFAAHFRVTHDMTRPNDRNILLQLGPHVEGDWTPW